MSQNRLLSGEELEQTYTAKMAAWGDSRLLWELDNVAKRAAEGNTDWARPEVMAAWCKCLRAEAERRFTDGEIVGRDNDNRLILWDAAASAAYNCGETVESYGLADITEKEYARLGLTAAE